MKIKFWLLVPKCERERERGSRKITNQQRKKKVEEKEKTRKKKNQREMYVLHYNRGAKSNQFVCSKITYVFSSKHIGGLGEKILETNQNLSNFPPQQNNPQNPLSYIFSPLFSIIPIFITTKRILRPSWQSHLID